MTTVKYRNELREKSRRKTLQVSSLILALLVFVGLLYLANDMLPKAVVRLAGNSQPNYSLVAGEVLGTKVSKPNSPAKFSTQTIAQDKRAYVLDQYFKDNDSPLYGTGNIFVKYCNLYPVPKDCITVAAIARAETDLCKYRNSADYYNCWGFGGGGEHRIYFNSWDESIERVTRSLAFSYGYRFMVDPRLMERTFCGSEPGCTGWGRRVIFHMDIIEEFSKSLGVGSLYALREE